MKPIEPSDQWTPIDEKVSMLMKENTRLIHEREDLIDDLEECKVELFKRMPPTQISDYSIRKAFERIRGSIDSFVFDTMGDVAGDDALYDFCREKQRKQKQKTRRFWDPLGKFINKQDVNLWGPYECSNFFILSVIIQWILDEFVFRKSYPLGISKAQIGLLEQVEKGMWHASRAQS